MNLYDDIPDTTVWLDSAVSSVYAGPGPAACGCNPTYGQSCHSCRGDGYGGAAGAAAIASWTYEGWVQAMREKAAREAGGAA